jgi:phage gp45-like
MMQYIRQLQSRLNSLITRGTISRVDDSTDTQNVQVELGVEEVDDQVEMAQPYGVSFVPPEGTEVVCVLAGAAPIAMCVGNPGDRPTSSATGTGGLYTSGEWRLFIDSAGVVHLGQEIGTSSVVLTSAFITAFQSALTAAIAAAVEGDGGAAALGSLNTALSSWSATIGSTKVKAT